MIWVEGGGGADLEHLLEDDGDLVGLGELGEGGLELVQHRGHLDLIRLRRCGEGVCVRAGKRGGGVSLATV